MGCCIARLAAHFVEQPAGTTKNSEEGAPCCRPALLRRSVDAARGGPSTSVDGGQGFVSGAETMEGERATAGEVVARPRQEQGRGGWSSTLGAARESAVAAWRHVQQREGGRAPWEARARPWERRGKEDGEPAGGDGRARLHADMELAIWSSDRGCPWLLGEQRRRPWELLAAMKQKGALGGEAAGGGAMGGASMRWGRRAPYWMGAERHGEKEPSSLLLA
jgi:hypothetical protein